jgi:hypothetical protein
MAKVVAPDNSIGGPVARFGLLLGGDNFRLSSGMNPDIDVGGIDHRGLTRRLNKQICAFGNGTNGDGAVPAIVPLAVRCRTAITLGVVLLLTVKSGLTKSIAVVVIAVAAGLVHRIVTRNVPRTVPSLGGIEKPEVL